MKKVLQIITRENDQLAEAIAAENQKQETELKVIRLEHDTADYEELLEAVFAADSVQCW